MPQIYYIDTLTWRDYYENRKDRFRPLGEWTLDFFKKAVRKECIIVYSDFVEDELRKDYDEKQIKEIFSVIDNIKLLKRVEVNSNQYNEAVKLCKERDIPFGDALHAIIARDTKAILISRDHHFEKLQDITISKKPEELL